MTYEEQFKEKYGFRPTFKEYHEFHIPKTHKERLHWLKSQYPNGEWDNMTTRQVKAIYIAKRRQNG